MEQHVAMVDAGALDHPKSKIASDFNWNVEWASLFIHVTGVWMVGLGKWNVVSLQENILITNYISCLSL